MSNTSDINSGILSMVSAIFAFVSLTAIQPILTFIASIIAIVSGIYSMYRNFNKNYNRNLKKNK
jgi:uncharacterized membrane protein HdeD (DUF308 family)